ncbi:MAG: MBL fold metallo-hydrolase [Armatimonadota bacterium]
MPTTLTFIGTASCTPPADDDTASFLLNEHVLIDCGWCAALSMLRWSDRDATDLSHVLITHCHHDHYMGLASVLFYRAMQRSRIEDAAELTVAGPAEDIERVVDLALDYLQADRFASVGARPLVVPVQPGDSLSIGELQVQTAPTRHPVQGLAYRIRDTRTEATLGISGDTAYAPELAELFRGVELLIMEGSTGLTDPDPDNRAGHSSALQSARIAADAGAGMLALVHVGAGRSDELLAAAAEIFPATRLPRPGETIVLEGRR